MADARPFRDAEELHVNAAEIWESLDPRDWLEAFSGHPKIGDKQSPKHAADQSQQWSRQEQSGVNESAEATIRELAVLNAEYEKKFGYIYIVCATGKSSEEMLAILRNRIENDAATELPIAAAEQAKITQLRLHRLVAR